MIQVDGLTKKYGEFLALNNASFHVEKGKILGFLGPNGAGKTTTMRILTCFIPATEGTAKIAGYDIFEESYKVRELIGYLPEKPPLYYDLTVRNYLKFIARIKGISAKNETKKIEEVIEKCALTAVADKMIIKTSKGYKQRVGIAQALIHDPDVLILDEPTSGLDPIQIAETRNLIQNLKGEHTIILSTHILPEVSRLCDYLAIINYGNIVEFGHMDTLTKKVQDRERLMVILKSSEKINKISDNLKKIEGVADLVIRELEKKVYEAILEVDSGKQTLKILAPFIINNLKYDLFTLKSKELTLEELYYNIITRYDRYGNNIEDIQNTEDTNQVINEEEENIEGGKDTDA